MEGSESSKRWIEAVRRAVPVDLASRPLPGRIAGHSTGSVVSLRPMSRPTRALLAFHLPAVCSSTAPRHRETAMSGRRIPNTRNARATDERRLRQEVTHDKGFAKVPRD